MPERNALKALQTENARLIARLADQHVLIRINANVDTGRWDTELGNDL